MLHQTSTIGKTDVLKTCWKSKFFENKIWRNALALKNCKTVSQISFNLLWSGGKTLLSEFLRKWGWFQGHNECFLIILAQNWNFKKLRHSFVDERAVIATKLISPCHWKTFLLFCLGKERPGNAFLILTVNYRKIVQKNKLCHPKQQ